MRQILSFFMSFVTLMTGAGVGQGSGGASSPAPASAYALAEAAYPEFPQKPVMPEEGPTGDWDAYLTALEDYNNALRDVGGPGLTNGDVDSLNAFAGKSIAPVLAGHEGKNAVYSPLSLWSALALLAQCADGDSRQQVLDAIGAANTGLLQDQVSRTWRALYTEDGQDSLTLANSIWLNSGLEGTYVQETLDTLAQKYFAGAYAVPMGTDEADQAVTGWVKEQTHGLIGGDQPVVETKAETLALLASSLYYRAGWTDEFQKDATQEDIFTDAAGKESKVDFMHRTEDAHFIRRDGYQAARLSARLGEMVFVLPDEGVAPESLLQDPGFLSGLNVSGADSHYGEVRWSVPKFDVDSDLNLVDALKKLGVTDLLDPMRADLTALTTLDAYVSDAKQLARVKVDEEGVEAAAVTIISMDCTSAMPPQDPEICVMDLERPFLFVIRAQGVPLFVGVVNQVQ